MFEAETNNIVETNNHIHQDICASLGEYRKRVLKRTVLPWGEHCTECVWPSCYITCNLYTPRQDGACRLFLEGMVRIPIANSPNPYVLKIKFKPWAKLWTVGNLKLYSAPKALFMEYLNIILGIIVQKGPFPEFLRVRAIHKIAYLRKIMAEKAISQNIQSDRPDSFVMECYNPNEREVNLSFTIRLRNGGNRACYQKCIRLNSGFTRTIVEFEEISKAVVLDGPFEVEIVPNDYNNVCLYFGLLDFVKERSVERASKGEGSVGPKVNKICKCIIWDLDNTLWDGVLIEDGPDRIKLRESALSVIKETDQRGILHSIASKNNKEDVTKVLKQLSIEDYFLYPQVNWEPKSQAIFKISKLLNIGIDSLIFVDDQEFEREEVKKNFPSVMVIDAKDINGIPQQKVCKVPITEESKTRRKMYREQEQRDVVLESYEGDYLKFVKECNMRLILSSLDETNIDRVFELTQRTNQMNFSGNRYSKSEIEKIMMLDHLQTYVMKCDDKFGSYGIVGFAVVDVREPRLLDLMFSCRIQGKKVDHAFLSYLLKEYSGQKKRRLFANYRKTPKNENAGNVFYEVNFRNESEKDGVTTLVFEFGQDILDYGIIDVSKEWK